MSNTNSVNFSEFQPSGRCGGYFYSCVPQELASKPAEIPERNIYIRHKAGQLNLLSPILQRQPHTYAFFGRRPKKICFGRHSGGKKRKKGKKNQNGRHSRLRRTEKKWLHRERKYKVSEERKMVCCCSVVFSRRLKALFLSFLCFILFFLFLSSCHLLFRSQGPLSEQSNTGLFIIPLK